MNILYKAGAPHIHGVWIAFEDITGGGCYSALGKNPGFRGRSPFTMTELGAPPGWQLMSFANNCGGETESTIMHEMLHALGVKQGCRKSGKTYLTCPRTMVTIVTRGT